LGFDSVFGCIVKTRASKVTALSIDTVGLFQ